MLATADAKPTSICWVRRGDVDRLNGPGELQGEPNGLLPGCIKGERGLTGVVGRDGVWWPSWLDSEAVRDIGWPACSGRNPLEKSRLSNDCKSNHQTVIANGAQLTVLIHEISLFWCVLLYEYSNDGYYYVNDILYTLLVYKIFEIEKLKRTQ